MKHKISGYKLQRNASARKALLRGLVTSVIVEERFTATVTKAKAAAPTVFLHFSILAFLVPSSPAQTLSSASQSTASIQGAVLDPNGKTVLGALVSAVRLTPTRMTSTRVKTVPWLSPFLISCSRLACFVE